VKGTLTAG